VARDFKTYQKDVRAVNWSDVSRTIAALEQQYGGLVKLQIDKEGTRNLAEQLWVRALAYRGWTDHGVRPIDVVTKLWPSNAHRTMAGACFMLLHQLDHALDARYRAESEDTPF